MTTELITFNAADGKCDDPKFAVCYARGSVFRKEGNFFRVQRGMRQVVHRSLCLVTHFGRRCEICPNHAIKASIEVKNGP